MIPLPDFRLDGFADGGHVLEVVVIFLRLVAAGLAQHANSGRRSVENVDVEAFRDAPGTSGIGKLRHAFVKNAGSGQRHRSIDDVGVAGDPADVSHAPVHVVGMDVLVILGRAGDVGEVAAGAMLAALGFAGGAAGVHQEERSVGIHGNGLDDVPAIIFQDFVDEKIALHDHGRVGIVFAVVAPPDQDFVDVLAFFLRRSARRCRRCLCGRPTCRCENSRRRRSSTRLPESAARKPQASPLNPPNTTEWITPRRAHASMVIGSSGNHGHVNGDAVAGFQSGKIAQHGGDFIHAAVQLLVGDHRGGFFFRLGNEDQRGFIFVLFEVAIDAVVAGVQLAADEPLPEGRIAGVERGVPVLVPVKQLGVFAKTFGEMLLR